MKIKLDIEQHNTHTLLYLLKGKGIHIPTDCNGMGHCGKCSVNVQGVGRQLACQYIPHGETVVETDSNNYEQISSTVNHTGIPNPNLVYVDLGSSTIAMVFKDEQLLFSNPCIKFGQDIISRIKSACEGNAILMRNLLREQIQSGIQSFRNNPQEVTDVYLAGNTAMIHLFMGYPCESLAVSPFVSYKQDSINTEVDGIHYHIPPCIGGFLGADYVMGLLSLDFQTRNDTCLFIDMGTNGELGICHNGNIYSCSVASGPAFEGGNLSCGCPSIPGAISQVTLGGVMPRIHTISNKLPIGLCGSGAISLFYELIRKDYVNASGILSDQFPFEGLTICRSSQRGKIVFTPKDFRNVQLAIASLQAGIYTLCNHAGISPSQLKHSYLAGGLGNVSFPFLSNVEYVGNACLSGLIRWAGQKEREFSKPKQISISLADDPYYKTELIQCMERLI